MKGCQLPSGTPASNFPSDFPITEKWPALEPTILQLYSYPAANGVKISAMLEEVGLDYEPHFVSFDARDQKCAEFLSLNPNGKIPAIIDPNGPGGAPLCLWESGAILLYLADKTGKMLSAEASVRYLTLQWMAWQLSSLAPMLGQFYYFHKGEGREVRDKCPFDRYVSESTRLLGILDEWLTGRRYVAGNEYSLADISIWPWIRVITTRYDAGELMGLRDFPELMRWYESCVSRPASVKAVAIPSPTM